MTVLEQAVEVYPTRGWNWLALSLNPAISFEFIQTHRDLPWVIKAVSRNSSITEDIVRSNKEFPWDIPGLCHNANISFNLIMEYAINPNPKLDINWLALSANPSITLDIIQQYPEHPWNDQYLSMNPNISTNYIKNEGASRNWSMAHLSANKGITERDIYKNSLPWDYLNLSTNTNLPAKYVHDNPDHAWNMFSVSSNPNISTTEIESFHFINWDPSGLSINPNINWGYVQNHPERNWSKQLLLTNRAITLDTIMDNLDYFDVSNYQKYLSSNPTITLAWIKKNNRLVDWPRLSLNTF